MSGGKWSIGSAARRARQAGGLAGLAVAALVAGGCGGEAPPAPSGRSMADATSPRASNGAPVLESVRIEPSSPRAGERVRVVATARDPEGDGLSYDYSWRVAGAARPDSAPELTLEDTLDRGARIEVVVVARDSQQAESAPMTASVSIGNQPPELAAVVLDPPGDVTRGNPVVARPRALDADGDDLSYTFSWRVNGASVDAEGDALDTSQLARGDTIQVRVVASDGQDESNAIESPPLRVANAAPRIVSQPGAFGADGTFRYEVRAEDPDGDRMLRFRLEKGPEGMTIDGLSGAIQWRPQLAQTGAHPVEVVVDDRQGGSAVQQFELRVSEAPATTAAPSADAPPASAAPDDEAAEAEDAEAAAPPPTVRRGRAPPAPAAPTTLGEDEPE